MTVFRPRVYQKAIIQHILNTPRCAVWAGMGMGKTAATLEALARMYMLGETKYTLVVAPLRVARTTWPDEVNKWDSFKGIKVIPIHGDKYQRRAALTQNIQFGEKPVDESKQKIFTINIEMIPWLVETVGTAWPFDTVVVDESTKLKGFRSRQGTMRAREFGRVAWHSTLKRFIELTGTPSPNGLQDLWGQIWFLDKGKRLGTTYTGFTERWFTKGYDGFSVKPTAYAQTQIESELSDLCISLDAKDYFDVREPIKNTIYVDLPPKAAKKYREMESEMFTQLEHDGIAHEVEAFNAAARTMKCLQLASGAAYVGEGSEEWVDVHDEKIQALNEIIEEAAGAPVLVAYHFKSDLERLLKAFPKSRVLDKNPDTIRDWNAGKIKVLFAHPASAGHGLNLQDGGNILVFFSHSWNLEEYLQIRERIGPTRQLQAGHDRPVFEHYIVARGTVDELVMARRETKREVQDLLLEAMKRKG